VLGRTCATASNEVSLLNRLAAIQLNRSIQCHWKKTQPHKQSVEHKNMKDNCRMTKQAYITYIIM